MFAAGAPRAVARRVIARVQSCSLVGIDAVAVDVEVDVSTGLPVYDVVGLPAPSVKEGAVRIRSALGTVKHDLPTSRVTVNLAPADLRKPGSALDLPIAVAVLIAVHGGHYGPRELKEYAQRVEDVLRLIPAVSKIKRIGDQICEAMELHAVARGRAAQTRCGELLELVGIRAERARRRC